VSDDGAEVDVVVVDVSVELVPSAFELEVEVDVDELDEVFDPEMELRPAMTIEPIRTTPANANAHAIAGNLSDGVFAAFDGVA
jgi:hypothetical protein